MDVVTPMIPLASGPPAVVPVLVGPINAIIPLIPPIAVALGRVIWGLVGPRALWRLAQLLWRQKLAVAGVAVVVVGLVYAWLYLVPEIRANNSGSVVEAGASDWAMFRGSLDRRGYRRGKVPEPDHGKKVWTFVDRDIRDFFCSPALVGNRLYVTSAKYEILANKGSICCLDADTGGLIWTYNKGGYRATFSSPSVKGKYLVVGEGVHFTTDARVFCLEAATGRKLWEYRTSSHVESSPCIFDDKVVIGAGDDGLYCFALEPDKNGNARIIWHLEGKDYPDCETAPIYHEGKVYWGLGNEGHALVCVDANTGKEQWRLPTPSPAFGSPAISGGRLYFGMGFGDFVNTSDGVAAALAKKLRDKGKSEQEIREAVAKVKREGEVWCVNLADRKVLWKFSVGQVVLSTPAVDADNNCLYVTSRDGKLYQITTEGELVRSFDMHEPLFGSPVVADEMVYVATGSGRVCGLDKARLKPVWNVALNIPSFSSPAVGRGHLYLGTNGIGLVCLGLPAEPWRRTAVWPGELGGAGKGGWDDSLLPDAGEYAWGYIPDPNRSKEFAQSVKAPAAHLEGDIYIGIGNGLAKLRSSEDLLTKPKQQWLAGSDNPVYLSASASKSAVFFVDGKRGDDGRFLRCLDPNTGAERWRRPVQSAASGASVITWDPVRISREWRKAQESNATDSFVFTWDRLLIAENASGLSCLDTSDPARPTEVWKADIGPTVGAPCMLGEDLVLVSVESPAGIVALEANSGARRWELPLPRPPTSGPVLSGPRVWVGDEAGLVGCWVPQTPKEIAGATIAESPDEIVGARIERTWTVACGPVRPTLAASGTWLACVTRDGEQLLVNTGCGQVFARLGKVVGDIPPVLTDDEALYLTKGSIQRYDLRTGRSTLWAKITPEWPGNILTPMIVANSRLIFNTDDEEGLVCMKPKK